MNKSLWELRNKEVDEILLKIIIEYSPGTHVIFHAKVLENEYYYLNYMFAINVFKNGIPLMKKAMYISTL